MSLPSHTQLLSSRRNYDDVRAALLRDYPGLDDETLADTLEGLTELPDLLCAFIRSMLEVKRFLPASLNV